MVNPTLYRNLVDAARTPGRLAPFINELARVVAASDSPWAAGAWDEITTDLDRTRTWLRAFVDAAARRGAALVWAEVPELEINPGQWSGSLTALRGGDASADADPGADIMAFYWTLDALDLDGPELPLTGLERLEGGFAAWAARGYPRDVDADRPLVLAWARYLKHMQDTAGDSDGPLWLCVTMHGPDEPQWVTRVGPSAG